MTPTYKIYWIKNIFDYLLFGAAHLKTRTGKSFKMSERFLLLGVKCPQSCVEKILQNRQLYVILPHFQPQIKLLCLTFTLE
jgi:hypothetical protein